MEINYLNLKRMFNHVLENVPEKMIRMECFRSSDDKTSHHCNSVGCVIGHCIILDDWENIPKFHDEIVFSEWSSIFTGMDCNLLSDEWKWCFGALWPNDKEQILLRLKYLIDNQKLPDDWDCDYYYLLPVEKLELYKI